MLPIASATNTSDSLLKRVVPGILFVAEILNQDEELSYNKEIHSEIKWIEKDKIYELREDECVPGFHDTVEKAFRIYNLYENK